MSIEQLSEQLRLLADPAQEVLIAGRPAFSQLAPVPLRQLGTDTITAGEPYRAYTSTPGGSYAPADGDDR